MTKKKKVILVIIIAIILITISFICGQVYGKYMSRISGQGTAEVASWSFRVNDNEEKIQTIPLKSTVNNQTLINNKIGPGTEGNFQIKLDGTGSEVGINYIIHFENEKNKPQNLKFIYENKTFNSITELEGLLSGVINANGEEKTKVIDIKWIWPYETGNNQTEITKNDENDTKDSQTIKNYTFDVCVTGTQVMPEA